MEKFKFRAECLRDVEELLRQINHSEMEVNIKFFHVPDVEVTLLTSLTLDSIIQEAREIDDCHVIVETIQPIQDYTGERDWSRNGA